MSRLGAPGMNGMLSMFPERGFVLVLLANRDPPAALEVERLVVRALVAPRE